jgi:hypothetical protein
MSQDPTYSADLHPSAVKWNLKPQLRSLTLSNVLSGETCSPIKLGRSIPLLPVTEILFYSQSLADFEGYLAYKVNSWLPFHSYS